MIRCTVGVMAHNEEENILQVLSAVLDQASDVCEIMEIVVVASGCTDRTVELAQDVARAHPIVRVDVQPQRAGKAAAINHLIRVAQGDVIVLVGADTLPDQTALDHLVRPFADPSVGMTGARPVPLNDPRTFLGFTVLMLWRVHHCIATRWPKLGELVAFRNVVAEIPVESATDEVALEALITVQGYRLVYTPDAVVYNRGPQTLADFFLQRRRIFAGHLHIAATYHYMAASMSLAHLIRLVRRSTFRYSNMLLWMIGAALLEGAARVLGSFDFLVGHKHHIWRPVRSTKQIYQQRQTLTLLVLSCNVDSITPGILMRSIRRIPASQGTLFWWDRRHHQVLFMLPGEQLTGAALEDRVKALAAAISPGSTPAGGIMPSYRIMQFTELLTLQPDDDDHPNSSGRLSLAS